MTIAARVTRFARRERLFRRTKSVLVAVSGGPDSVACLLLLRELRAEFGFEVHAAHFDHMLRPESKDEMAFVRELCATLEIPCLTGEGDVGAMARRQKVSVEAAARTMRYQFLGFVAAQKGLDAVATGHTASDQAETVLMRVVRGTGVRGIRGMLPVSDVPGSAQRLVRPLLELTRAETLAVCAEAGIEPRDDATNRELTATRNRLRHVALPALREVNPSVEQALLGLAKSAREAFEDIERKAMSVTPLERGPVGAIYALPALAGLPNEAMTLVVEREAGFFHMEAEVNRTRVENLRRVLTAGTGVVLFGDLAVQASAGKVRVGPPLAAEPFEGRILDVPGTTRAGAWRVDVRTSPLAAEPGSQLARVDPAAVEGALRVRALQPGDRVRYHGIERKVADVLANAKAPAWERLGALAIADRVRVHAVLTATATFEADLPPGADPMYVRAAAAAPPSPPALVPERHP